MGARLEPLAAEPVPEHGDDGRLAFRWRVDGTGPRGVRGRMAELLLDLAAATPQGGCGRVAKVVRPDLFAPTS